MDGRAWWAAVYGVAQSRTRLMGLSSSSTIFYHTPNFSGNSHVQIILKGNESKNLCVWVCLHAWKIPWTEEPGRLQSMGSLRVGHD